MTATNLSPSLTALLARGTITKTLGLDIQKLDKEAGTLEVHYTATQDFLNPAGQVQGGILSAMLDDVTGILVLAMVEPEGFGSTLTLNTSFIASAKPGLLLAKAYFERQGNSVCNVRGEIWQGNTLVASASAVCLIRRMTKSS